MEKFYRLLYPMRVCLITSKSGEKDNLMSASWVFPLSMDPPLFGVSISSKRFSHSTIKEGKDFVIAIPEEWMVDAVKICGTKSGRDTDKFSESGLTKENSAEVKAPSIKECPVNIECILENEIVLGDHSVFVGRAVNVTKKKDDFKGIYQSHKSPTSFIEV
ncbi:flavin reductase family protein [Candidatus Micrarchaeota archaeon]|nr:flavin reductase family protein [Candidatus Micrarchaeota archaeon]